MDTPAPAPTIAPDTPPPVVAKKPTLVQLIIKQKTAIIWAWIATYIFGVISMIMTIVLPPLHTYWYELGAKTGTLAVLLLALTLVPGMIRRFGLKGPFMQLQLLLMVFRRHLGISMYIFALAHAIYAKYLPMFAYTLPLTFASFEIAGVVALFLTTPLFTTSNDFFVHKLGTRWHRLHTLVYAIALLVLIHLVLLGGNHLITYVSLATVIAEALSWSFKWYQTKRVIAAGLLLLGLLLSTTAYASYTYLYSSSLQDIEFSRESLMAGGGREGGQSYSLATVSKHSSSQDCWTVIHDKIYDITAYVNVHPGGVETIRGACGVDGTVAFDTKGSRGRPHLQSTTGLLAGYLVASVGDIIPGTVPLPPSAPNCNATPLPTNAPPLQMTYNLTADVVSMHRTQNDCWLIIDGHVYDVSKYVQYHPGGIQQILSYCGKEATSAFATKGGGGSDHTSNAKSTLASLSIGNLNQKNVSVDMPKVTFTPPPAGGPTSPPTPVPVSSSVTLTSSLVATHNSQGNCWFIVTGNVYDVTQYIQYHPGGVATIVNSCGKDATNAFNTKGGGGSSHSSNAQNLLAGYKIGPLGSVSATTPTPPPAGGPTATPKPTILPTPVPPPAGGSTTLTTAVVATHNSQGNCWIIVSNTVYDVTQYIQYHPGGVATIVNSCGKDATNAFNTKGGGGGSHSGNANSLLANYKIGALGSTTTSTPVPAGGTTGPTPTPQTVSLTSSVVATHNSQSNCWLIINGNVYDVSQYIPYHPGGTRQIVNYCGKEASTAFNTRGGNSRHSSSANTQLAGYMIGNLNGTTVITPTPVPAGGPNATSTPTPRPRDDDDDD